MIGVDIVEIERIKNIYLKHGNLFIDKILNAQECKELPNKQNVVFFRQLSCFIASKEAIFKACSCENLDWKEISITGLRKNHSIYIKNTNFSKKIFLSTAIERKVVLAQAISICN